MSRSTIINQLSQSVTGTFPLYDLLSITTMSGSINITVIPQPASSSAKAPAALRLSTMSGAINVTMAPFLNNDTSRVLPERVFDFSVKSMSGPVSAALVHNSQTTLSTMSGNMTASIHPCPHPLTTRSHINIQNISGSTSLTLHPHIITPYRSLETLSTTFSGGSGDLRVRFPSTWEGEVDARLGSGRVRCDGWEGLRLMQDEGGRFRAVVGNGCWGARFEVWGSSMWVEMVGEKVPGSLAEDEEVVSRREGVEYAPHPPVEGERPERGLGNDDDDDDWTVVGDEDGEQEVIRRPPPSYEDATTT